MTCFCIKAYFFSSAFSIAAICLSIIKHSLVKQFMQGILDGYINIPNVEFVSTPSKPCKKVAGSQKSRLLHLCLENLSSNT